MDKPWPDDDPRPPRGPVILHLVPHSYDPGQLRLPVNTADSASTTSAKELMPDPSTLSVLTSATLTEVVRFLFNQATTLLHRHSTREPPPTPECATSELEIVPLVTTTVLDGCPTSDTVSGVALAAISGTLSGLIEDLRPTLETPLLREDRELIRVAEHLRTILEQLYGQTFTFQGESRPHTGTRIAAHQIIGTLHGAGTALDYAGSGADISVTQQVSEVSATGSATAAIIRTHAE